MVFCFVPGNICWNTSIVLYNVILLPAPFSGDLENMYLTFCICVPYHLPVVFLVKILLLFPSLLGSFIWAIGSQYSMLFGDVRKYGLEEESSFLGQVLAHTIHNSFPLSLPRSLPTLLSFSLCHAHVCVKLSKWYHSSSSCSRCHVSTDASPGSLCPSLSPRSCRGHGALSE